MENFDFRIELTEQSPKPSDFNSYSKEDFEAFLNEDWRFVNVTVVPQNEDFEDIPEATVYFDSVDHGNLSDRLVGRKEMLDHPLTEMISRSIDLLGEEGHSVKRIG